MPHRLDNYLRMYRRRAGLSQDEMAFILGAKEGTKVSRYERFARTPTLETAYAYEVVFQETANALFGGIYDKVERRTLKRIRTLVARLEHEGSSRLTDRKLAVLRDALRVVADR